MTFRLSHLAVLLALTIVAAAILGVAATYEIADAEFRDVLHDDLENQSELLAELLAADGVRLNTDDLQELLNDSFEPDGEETLWATVYNARTGRAVSNLPHAIPADMRDREWLRLSAGGYEWHGHQSDEDHIVVALLRRADLFEDVQEQVLEDIITPAVAGGVVNLLLLSLLIGFFLWPLTQLVRQLEIRSANSLTPLHIKTPAREILVLRDTLNNLMSGVDEVLTRERQFASDVAHELRTPLTTLQLELADAEPDLRAAKAEVGRLSRLVEQLLTLARLEQGQWQQQFAAVPLADVFGRVLERFRDKFQEAGFVLESRLVPVTVDGDVTLLEILLRNLLDNVLDHCPPGCRVEVLLDNRDGPVRLRVSDTGHGIADEKRRRMSEGFTRLDSKSEGYGLGLAICHKIAEVHGASLVFTAREDNASGLRIEVVFPAGNTGGQAL